MTISGVKNICWAKDPGLTSNDKLMVSVQGAELDAVGPWSDKVDDGNSGEFSESSEIRNGVVIYTSTLTFRVCDDVNDFDLPQGCNAQAWKFTERNGKTYFIGNGMRPYPTRVISTENSRSNNAKTKTITVTWVSRTGVLRKKV